MTLRPKAARLSDPPLWMFLAASLTREEFHCQGRVYMLGNVFPAREGFPIGQWIPCQGTISLSGKSFPIREGFSSQGRVSLLRKGFF